MPTYDARQQVRSQKFILLKATRLLQVRRRKMILRCVVKLTISVQQARCSGPARCDT